MMNSSLKRIVGYFVYVIAFGSFVIVAEQLQRYLTNLFSSTYDPTYYWTFLSLYPILVELCWLCPDWLNYSDRKDPGKSIDTTSSSWFSVASGSNSFNNMLSRIRPNLENYYFNIYAVRI